MYVCIWRVHLYKVGVYWIMKGCIYVCIWRVHLYKVGVYWIMKGCMSVSGVYIYKKLESTELISLTDPFKWNFIFKSLQTWTWACKHDLTKKINIDMKKFTLTWKDEQGYVHWHAKKHGHDKMNMNLNIWTCTW